MNTVVSRSGRSYSLKERIAGGGEGDIFSISDDPYRVIKIFKQPTIELDNKLEAMVRSPLRDSNVLTWPQELIIDRSGRCIGYLMDRVYGGVPINAIYEYGSKSSKKVPWKHRLTIAINICCALNDVHSKGQIIGDFNPKNMFVNVKSGHIKLVDTDSYHITSGNQEYRCSVSMPNYLAPEIAARLKNGEKLSTIELPTFTKNSDNFALAIHIYQLLMNGAHPYQGAIKSSVRTIDLPPIKNNIIAGIVPSINSNSSEIGAPVYSPPFEWLPPIVQSLFKKAFILGTGSPNSRPSSRDWYNALVYYHNNLTDCRQNTLHSYYKMAPECPLCLSEQMYNKIFSGMTMHSKSANNKYH